MKKRERMLKNNPIHEFDWKVEKNHRRYRNRKRRG